MTKEELLKPRYKVIANVPFHSIAGFNTIPIGYIFEYEWIFPIGANFTCVFADYPHLFKKLEWWEERAESDMPKYVKWGYTGAPLFTIEKVSNWTGCGKVIEFENGNDGLSRFWLPSDEQEYLQFINQKQTTNG